MPENLERCPFCGAEAYVVVGTYKTVIACSRFDILTHRVYYSAPTKEEAIELWNTRARLMDIVRHSYSTTSKTEERNHDI